MPTLEKRYRTEYHTIRRLEGRAIVEAARQVPCADCGGEFPGVCMDFHHRDPETKKFVISEWWSHASSLGTLQAEIDKCDIICANCHRIREHLPL